MSRTLDYDNLSQDDLAYLSQREILVQEATAALGRNPLEGYQPDVDPLGEFDRPNVSGTIVSGSATIDVPGNLDVNRFQREAQEDDEDYVDEGVGWNESMKKGALQDVIDARNEGRDETGVALIEPEGTTKADLVAALEKDDEDGGGFDTHNSLKFPDGDPDADESDGS